MVFLLCWTLILLSDKAHYSRGVASPVQFEQTLNPSEADSTVLQGTAVQCRSRVCAFTKTARVFLATQRVVPCSQYSKARMDSLRILAGRTKKCSKRSFKAPADVPTPVWYNMRGRIRSNHCLLFNLKQWSCSYFTIDRRKSGDRGSLYCNASAVRLFWQHVAHYMSCYPLHLYIRFYCKMKVALVKLIWKSADLSLALPDPDSCMEMRSQTDALYLWESIQALLFFSLSENEEPGLDARSLRGWKFNLEMAHISKPAIIGILCSVF